MRVFRFQNVAVRLMPEQEVFRVLDHLAELDRAPCTVDESIVPDPIPQLRSLLLTCDPTLPPTTTCYLVSCQEESGSREPLLELEGDDTLLTWLRNRVREGVEVIEAEQQRVAEAARLRTVEEIDQVTAELAAAVDELKAQRERLLRGEPAAP